MTTEGGIETSLLRNVRVFYKEGEFSLNVTDGGTSATLNLPTLEEPFRETFEARAKEQLDYVLGLASNWGKN